MKKIMTTMLGLSFILGTVSYAFAQDTTKTTATKKAKKTKKSTSTTKS